MNNKELKEKRNVLYKRADDELEVVMSDSYRFLDFMALMAKVNYGLTNSLLVYEKKPYATELKSIEGWQNKNIMVIENQIGIEILSPGDEFKRKNGTTGINFIPRFVFDISQTDGQKYAETPPDFQYMVEALMTSNKIKVHVGYVESVEYDASNNLMLYSPELSEETAMNGLFLEFAKLAIEKKNVENSRQLFMANCVGYMLSVRFHIKDFNTFLISNSFDSFFEGMELKEIKNELTIIQKTYKEIKDGIAINLSNIYKDHRNG